MHAINRETKPTSSPDMLDDFVSSNTHWLPTMYNLQTIRILSKSAYTTIVPDLQMSPFCWNVQNKDEITSGLSMGINNPVCDTK